MPRTAPPPATVPSTIVAAATRIQVAGAAHPRHRPRRKTEAWQAQAWEHYDCCGELRYGTNWFANSLSQARLFAGRLQDDGSIKRHESGPAKDALDALFSNDKTQATLLKAMAPHYFVGGEWYLVGRENPEDPTGADIWEVLSPTEISVQGSKWTIDHGDGVRITLTNDDFITRMWNPHPRRHSDPDSPVRAVLDVLSEIMLLTRHIAAQVRSRLAGAGLLLLPSEMSFTPPANAEGDVTGEDEFIQTLYDAMQAAIDDPGDPSALVPIVVQAAGEHLNAAQHMTFWSSLDEQAVSQRESAIKRLALGLDLPPEVLTGTGEMNHWGAWAVDEATVKSHLEPALDVICASLTTGFLQAMPGVDPMDVVAWDTSSLRLRPNRSKEALELYDRGELKPVSLRRETGFDESDAPSDDERKQWLLQKVASGSATPEQVEAALRLLGVNIVTQSEGETREARPDPSLIEHPEQGPPDTADDLPPGLVSACDVLCMRALERAGNRIKGKFKVSPPNVDAVDLYRFVTAPVETHGELMNDAWGMVERAVTPYGKHPASVQAALDTYVRDLLLTQREHEVGRMKKFLQQVGD